ncbi:zinc-binding dehydrogenase [Pasteurellaceae bacterium LIM206]|nr:zinc-binding dehydrogenase [Pasteurellaceae bacterium LIM206]
MQTMKAAVLIRPCTAEEFTVSEVPVPAVKSGWVLVKIRAFGLNRAEIYTRQGLSPSVKLPRIIGIECVGEVADPSDSGLAVGQKVVSLMKGLGREFDGSYAEYALIPSSQVYPVESNLDWALLAAIPETYYTAYGSLFYAMQIEEGKTLLVRGGTTAAGLAAIQLACAQGLKVYATSRTEENFAKLTELGAVALTDNGNLADSLPEKVDYVFELVGAGTVKDSLKCVKRGGKVCFTGILSGWIIKDFYPIDDIPSGVYLTAFHSDNVDGEQIQAMFRFIRRHAIHIAPPTVFTLDEIGKAHKLMEENALRGKAVVVNP